MDIKERRKSYGSSFFKSMKIGTVKATSNAVSETNSPITVSPSDKGQPIKREKTSSPCRVVERNSDGVTSATTKTRTSNNFGTSSTTEQNCALIRNMVAKLKADNYCQKENEIYIFDFDKVYEYNKTVMQLFKKYIYLHQSYELCNFLKAYEVFSTEQFSAAKYKQLMDIRKDFIVTGAKEELNLPFQVRDHTEMKIREVSEDSPINVLDEALGEVLIDVKRILRQDLFPKFVRSEIFENYLKRTSEQELLQFATKRQQ